MCSNFNVVIQMYCFAQLWIYLYCKRLKGEEKEVGFAVHGGAVKRSMFPLTQLQLSNRHKDVHAADMNDTSVKVSLLTERKYTDEKTSKELWVVMSEERGKHYT